MEAAKQDGPCLWMVCYRFFSMDGRASDTYWNVYPAATEEEATAEAEREGLFKDGRRHRWTCQYNRAGMTVAQTYAAYLEEQGVAA